MEKFIYPNQNKGDSWSFQSNIRYVLELLLKSYGKQDYYSIALKTVNKTYHMLSDNHLLSPMDTLKILSTFFTTEEWIHFSNYTANCLGMFVVYYDSEDACEVLCHILCNANLDEKYGFIYRKYDLDLKTICIC